MAHVLTIRRSDAGDFAAVDLMLSQSYPRLLAPDYPPSTMVMAVPIMSRARPDLIASGRYFVATDDDHVVGAGGWSTRAASERTSIKGIGHVRHVVTDYRHQRQGIGRALMTAVMADARAAGMAWMDCMSTRTAVSFYESLGFRVVQTVDVPLGPGIVFPAIRMLGAL